MDHLQFSCNGCVFLKDAKCLLNRLEKLNPNNLEKFDRFCNTYRPQHWFENYADQNFENAINIVREEVRPRLTFIVKFNYDMDFLSSLLDNINNQTINNRKFVVVINDKVEYNLSIFELMQSKLTNNVGGYNLIQSIDLLNAFDQGFDQWAKNGWTVFLEAGINITTTLAQQLDTRINEQLIRLVYAENSDKSKIIVQSAIYKLLGGNHSKVLKDGSVEDRPFLERLKSMSNDDPNCIVSWEELFNE